MRSSAGTIALCLVAAWLFAALFSPLFEPAAVAIDLNRILETPSAAAWFGRDDLGRCLAARLVVGARSALLIAILVVFVSASTGIAAGLMAAWFGGWIDLVIARSIDVFLAFPGILLAIALAGVLGPGLGNLVIALGAVGWVGFARLTRAQALSIMEREHVLSARSLGVRNVSIAIRHVLPLAAGPLIVEATFAFAGIIVAEAGLSFLGLGVQAPVPSWGSLIRDGVRYLVIAPHHVLVPAAALMSLVIALNLLGDRLRDQWSAQGRGD